MFRISIHVLLLFIIIATEVVHAADAKPQSENKKQPNKSLPMPGDVFAVDGCTAFVIPPAKTVANQPTPWVWYAPTLPGLPAVDENWMFDRFTAAGIAIAGIDVGESYGSPTGRSKYTSFYKTLVDKRNMSPKPVLLARSRGGLMLYCWACENADKVGGVAGIYPVCNVASYPGVERAAAAYQLPADKLQQELSKHNPLDRLESLAKAKVPLFAIHGDVDTVVPLEANSGEMSKRYKALGGKMDFIVPKGQGHNMWRGFFECRELADFVIQHGSPQAATP